MADINERVIIVGAGPVGLVAAASLLDKGIPVLLLEATADLAEDLRASTFHPPTLDMLDRLGVAQTLGAAINPEWQILAGHVAFVAVLLVRPRGLFPRSND